MVNLAVDDLLNFCFTLISFCINAQSINVFSPNIFCVPIDQSFLQPIFLLNGRYSNYKRLLYPTLYNIGFFYYSYRCAATHMAYRYKTKSYGTKSIHRAPITYGIKISEISKDVTELQLRHYFARFGPISSISLKLSSPFNHAFVNYQVLADAKAATVTMNGARIGQNALKVKLQNDDYSISQPVQDKKYTLKISNINPSTTKERLSMLFKTDVTLNVVSGKPNYAYANYDHEADVKDGLKFHDLLLDGFNIQVKLSRSSVDHSILSQISDSSQAPHQFSVKISNIHPTTTEERLSELFKTTVILNTVPGGPNYGYANYASEVGVNYALNLHNFVVDDFKIQVKAKAKSR